jgi:hypothetical protein
MFGAKFSGWLLDQQDLAIDAVVHGVASLAVIVIASEAKQSRAVHDENWIASSLRSSQ